MAENYYPTDCDEDVLYDCQNCDNLVEHARVRHAGTVKKSYIATLLAALTDPTVWGNGIRDGNIKLIPDVLGSWNGGVPKEGTGYGDQTTTISSFEHEVAFKDQRFKNNSAFYNAEAKAKDRIFFFVTETQIFFSKKVVTVLPKSPATENLDDKINWDVTVKWLENEILIPHDRLDEILSCSFIAAQVA